MSTVLALMALISDPSFGLFATGLVLTGVVAVIGGIRVKRLSKQMAQDTKEGEPREFVMR